MLESNTEWREERREFQAEGGTKSARAPGWELIGYNLITARNLESWMSECRGGSGERRPDFILRPLLWPARPCVIGPGGTAREAISLPISKDHDLNIFPVLMCSFLFVTLGEFEGIDVYFKSHSQQLA